MISDVLSDAVTEIDRYEKDFVVSYGDPLIKEKLRMVKAMMDALRAELDCSPFVKPYISPADQSGLASVSCKFKDGSVVRWDVPSDGREG